MSYIREPKIRIDFNSPDGNIFVIRAKAIGAIKAFYVLDKAEKLKEFDEKWEQIKDKTYEDALNVIREFVEIEEE